MAVVLGRCNIIIIINIQQGQDSNLSTRIQHHNISLKRTTFFFNDKLKNTRAQTIIGQIR